MQGGWGRGLCLCHHYWGFDPYLERVPRSRGVVLGVCREIAILHEVEVCVEHLLSDGQQAECVDLWTKRGRGISRFFKKLIIPVYGIEHSVAKSHGAVLGGRVKKREEKSINVSTSDAGEKIE